MQWNIVNFTSKNFTNMAADVTVGSTFTYRFISRVDDGIHTFTLRDMDRNIVARVSSEKGHGLSRDFMWNWVYDQIKARAN